MLILQEKRRLVKQVDSLELALQIKADEVAELKAKLEAEIKGRLEEQHHHEQVWEKKLYAQFVEYTGIQYLYISAVIKFKLDIRRNCCLVNKTWWLYTFLIVSYSP